MPVAAEKEWLSWTKVIRKTRLLPFGEAVDLGEKPARVAVLFRRHDLDRRNGRLFHLHLGTPVHDPAVSGRALLARSGGSRPPRIGAMCREKRPYLVGALGKQGAFQKSEDLILWVYSGEEGSPMSVVTCRSVRALSHVARELRLPEPLHFSAATMQAS